MRSSPRDYEVPADEVRFERLRDAALHGFQIGQCLAPALEERLRNPGQDRAGLLQPQVVIRFVVPLGEHGPAPITKTAASSHGEISFTCERAKSVKCSSEPFGAWGVISSA